MNFELDNCLDSDSVFASVFWLSCSCVITTGSEFESQIIALNAAETKLSAGKVAIHCTKIQIDGDIFSNLRKGQVRMNYDLKFVVHWGATYKRSADTLAKSFAGKFDVNNVCDDTPSGEWEIGRTTCEETSTSTDSDTNIKERVLTGMSSKPGYFTP